MLKELSLGSLICQLSDQWYVSLFGEVADPLSVDLICSVIGVEVIPLLWLDRGILHV